MHYVSYMSRVAKCVFPTTLAFVFGLAEERSKGVFIALCDCTKQSAIFVTLPIALLALVG